MSHLHVALLGGYRVRQDGQDLALSKTKEQALLAYLLREWALALRAQRRDGLAELLWPSMPSGSRGGRLRPGL